MSEPMDEEWRPVPGHEGRYEVSDLGRVRSIGTVNARGRRQTPRTLTPALDSSGRRMVSLSANGIKPKRRVYTLVLEAFVGPRPPGMVACHYDGNPANDRLDNLRWDTQAANCADSARHGTDWRGRRSHCQRGHCLTEWNIVPHLWSLRRERTCLACQRAKGNRRYARSQGRDIDLDAVADRHFARLCVTAGTTQGCGCPSSWGAAA